MNNDTLEEFLEEAGTVPTRLVGVTKVQFTEVIEELNLKLEAAFSEIAELHERLDALA